MIELAKEEVDAVEKKELERITRRLEYFKVMVRPNPYLTSRCKVSGCHGRGWYGVNVEKGELLLCCGDLRGGELAQIAAAIGEVNGKLEEIYKASAFFLPIQAWMWFKRVVLRRKDV